MNAENMSVGRECDAEDVGTVNDGSNGSLFLSSRQNRLVASLALIMNSIQQEIGPSKVQQIIDILSDESFDIEEFRKVITSIRDCVALRDTVAHSALQMYGS